MGHCKKVTKDSFDLIPAIDVLGGKCVRLTQGKFDQVEEFSTDPEEIAKKWVEHGAKRIHVVDLDGAKEGSPINFKIIAKIAKLSGIQVQVGGGIRSIETINTYLDEGIDYVILGTKAFQDKAFLGKALDMFREKVIVGLDMKNKEVALAGWEETIDINLNKLCEYLRGVEQIIYTDTTRDGTLSGPNLNFLKEIATLVTSKIIVSGGVSSMNDVIDIINLKNKELSNISGIILGKSLYKGTIDLKSAINFIENKI